MAREYTPRPPKGPIRAAAEAAERAKPGGHARVIAREMARPRLRQPFEAEGVSFRVVNQPHLAEHDDRVLELEVLAFKDGEPLPLGDNIFQWVNPAVEVPNGTWRKEIVRRLAHDNDPAAAIDAEGMVAEEIDAPNFVEDPREALREQIVQVVLTVARQNGWVG